MRTSLGAIRKSSTQGAVARPAKTGTQTSQRSSRTAPRSPVQPPQKLPTAPAMPVIVPIQRPISVRLISCTRSMKTGTQNMKP